VTPGPPQTVFTLQALNNAQLLSCAAMMIEDQNAKLKEAWDAILKERGLRFNAEEFAYKLKLLQDESTKKVNELEAKVLALEDWERIANQWAKQYEDEKSARVNLAKFVEEKQSQLSKYGRDFDSMMNFITSKMPGIAFGATDNILTIIRRAFDIAIAQRDELLHAAIKLRDYFDNGETTTPELEHLGNVISMVASGNPFPGYVSQEVEEKLRRLEQLESREELVKRTMSSMEEERKTMETHLENLKKRHAEEVANLQRQLSGVSDDHEETLP
jgi:hypothetical protein